MTAENEGVKHNWANESQDTTAPVKRRMMAVQEPGKRLNAALRAELIEFARVRIQAVWDDVGTTDAQTLAENVVSAQEFLWLSLHFPVDTPTSAPVDLTPEVLARWEKLAEACMALGIDTADRAGMALETALSGVRSCDARIAELERQLEEATRHDDPYCATHCGPTSHHSQCGCRCKRRRGADDE